jgi:hypothetical protein
MSLTCQRISRARCYCLFADCPMMRLLPRIERGCGLFMDRASPCSRLVHGESTIVD